MRQFSTVPLSPEERLRGLSQLIDTYSAISNELRDSKEAYQLFFAQLAAGVQRALHDKSVEMRVIEQERLASYNAAVAQQDETLQQLAAEDGVRLLHGVRFLGQTVLLLFKKIALCQEGITRLAEDQECQRQVLTQLVGHLESHRRAYERRKRIDKIVREVAEMAKVALEFESYMRKRLGPLQDVLDQVVRVDEALHRTVAEIEDLTKKMLQQSTLLLSDDVASELTTFDKRVLDFLTAGQLKKDRLIEIWEHLERQDGSEEAINIDLLLTTGGSPAHSVLNALDNIQTLVGMRLAPLISAQGTVNQTRLPALPYQLLNQQCQKSLRCHTVWRRLVTKASQYRRHVFGSPHRHGMEFVLIQAGTFSMGSTVFHDEQPVHEVHIRRPFYIGKCPVTQRQWEAVMGNNPSYFRGNPDRPVENVSWWEVQTFIQRLNETEENLSYRLPTEAEWEYAARTAPLTASCFGNARRQLHNYAWYEANAGCKTHQVKQLKPNAWGLYDVLGNVWEWTQDWYHEEYYAHSPLHDPHGPASGAYRVVRGGSWDCDAGDCRSASRNIEHPDKHTNVIGFRLVREFGVPVAVVAHRYDLLDLQTSRTGESSES
jgi:formylglycine-generating enzyme required for sulfatase activity